MQPRRFSAIAPPRGHETFTLEGTKVRCSCGDLLGDRVQYGAHLVLFARIHGTAAC